MLLLSLLGEVHAVFGLIFFFSPLLYLCIFFNLFLFSLKLRAVHEQLAALSQGPISKPKRKREKKEKKKKRKAEKHRGRAGADEDDKGPRAPRPSQPKKSKKAGGGGSGGAATLGPPGFGPSGGGATK